MKWYDKNGNEISKSTFYRRAKELDGKYPIIYSEDKANKFKRLMH